MITLYLFEIFRHSKQCVYYTTLKKFQVCGACDYFAYIFGKVEFHYNCDFVMASKRLKYHDIHDHVPSIEKCIKKHINTTHWAL